MLNFFIRTVSSIHPGDHLSNRKLIASAHATIEVLQEMANKCQPPFAEINDLKNALEGCIYHAPFENHEVEYATLKELILQCLIQCKDFLHANNLYPDPFDMISKTEAQIERWEALNGTVLLIEAKHREYFLNRPSKNRSEVYDRLQNHFLIKGDPGTIEIIKDRESDLDPEILHELFAAINSL